MGVLVFSELAIIDGGGGNSWVNLSDLLIVQLLSLYGLSEQMLYSLPPIESWKNAFIGLFWWKNDRNDGIRQSGILKSLVEYVQRHVCFLNVQSSLHEKCRLFCLCVHVQCRVYYIYHVEFHFRFRHLLSFPVKHQLWSGCHSEKSSKKISGNFLRSASFLRSSSFFRSSSFLSSSSFLRSSSFLSFSSFLR